MAVLLAYAVGIAEETTGLGIETLLALLFVGPVVLFFLIGVATRGGRR